MSLASYEDFAQVVTIVVVVTQGQGSRRKFWPRSNGIKSWNGLTGANILAKGLDSLEMRGNSLKVPLYCCRNVFSDLVWFFAGKNQLCNISYAVFFFLLIFLWSSCIENLWFQISLCNFVFWSIDCLLRYNRKSIVNYYNCSDDLYPY